MLKNKDRKGLDWLYDHYSAALYGHILRIVKNQEIAEEVLQDIFLKIWNKFDSYDENKGKLFTWMVNIARNQSIDKIRSKEITRQNKTGDIGNFVNRIDNQENVEQRTEEIGITDLLKILPEEQRFVVDHLYLKGYTQSELAGEFNIPLGTVKTRLRLAMQQLRITLRIK